MDETAAQAPQPIEFVIPESEAYAMTAIEIWQVIEFLLTKLEAVDLEELHENDRVCPICHQEFSISEDVKRTHPPVKTVCGHIFGKKCIMKWLDPLREWGLKEDLEAAGDLDDDPRSDCPICRRVFVPRCGAEPLENLALRLVIWDSAYDSVEVTRSEKEERSREHLWEYVNYCSSIDEKDIDGREEWDLQCDTLLLLADWAKRLKQPNLTPEQENLRDKLERCGGLDLLDCDCNDSGLFFFDLDPDWDDGQADIDSNESDDNVEDETERVTAGGESDQEQSEGN